MCVVHGDDFTFCDFDEDLDWIENLMMSWFEVKVRARSGPDKSDDSEVTILGRTVRWKDWGIEHETDHRSEVLSQLTNDRVDECKEEVDEVELSESDQVSWLGGKSELLGAGLPRPSVPSQGGLPLHVVADCCIMCEAVAVGQELGHPKGGDLPVRVAG